MQEVAKLIKNSTGAAVLTGAGVSTESGIPDFRSSTGLYTQNQDAMNLLSLSSFFSRPAEFYRFFKDAFLRYSDVEPNPAHKVLAKWQQEGRVRAIITQNVDGLHQKAGATYVLELHGHLRTAYCPRCKTSVPMSEVAAAPGPYPTCKTCNIALKPDVVLFEESLPEGVFEQALQEVEQADLMLVVGTSLSVSPANYLVNYRNPNGRLVIINKEATPYDHTADYVIYGRAGQTLLELDQLISS